MRVLQRVVMPIDHDLDVLKLYLEGRATVLDRRRLAIKAGRRVSFASYFNAFPASYWRRWSSVPEIELKVRLRGEATVIVYRSSARGNVSRVAAGTGTEHRFTLTLRPFLDGGWYWFDIVAGDHDVVLESADWGVPGKNTAQGRVSLGITTYNRPEFCVDQLVALGQAAEVLDVVDAIYVVDQGTQRIADHPGYKAAAEALGDRLKVIDQPNLGGSGGFARAMDETVRAGRSDYVLLLDDDVVTEPEGILRAVAFADVAKSPMIVGGHMFNLYARSQLHAFAESIAPYRWWWGPVERVKKKHDFARKSLATTSWLHRRLDADYNGWWMCLIPVQVIEKTGLAMPMFIKWDDAEYCVRAKAAGFATVSLPGVAVWHVPWVDKDDGLDWQAYFHQRNRLVTALLHSPYERGGNLLKESFILTVKHALAMEYSTAELMLTAIEDVLTGPAHMHAQIGTKAGEVRAFRAEFSDARPRPEVEAFPAVRAKPLKRGRMPSAPSGTVAVLRSAMSGAWHQLKPVGDAARQNPQITVPHIDRHWSLLSQFDSALVSSADGTQTSWYVRDPRRFRALVARSTALHTRLTREWPELSRAYKDAAPELCSPEAWRSTFGTAE